MAEPYVAHGTLEAEGARARLAAAAHAWAAAERGRFVPWLAVAAIAGDLAYFALRAEPPSWTGLAALLLCAALAALLWRRPAARAAALFATAAAIGFLSAQAAALRATPMPELPRGAVELTATVRAVDVLPEARRLVLDHAILADEPALDRRIRVRLKRGDDTPVTAGDLVRLRALLRPPAAPAYPGAWDFQRDSFFEGLGGGGTALSPVTILEHHDPTGLGATVQAARDALGARIRATVPGPAGAIAATFLTGATAAIPDPDRAAFRDSGLAHLLAVAGLHIGIVMGLLFGATRLALAAWERAALHWPTKQIAALAALAAGAVYMAMAGAHVPVMRSFAMACLVTAGLLLGRRAVSLRSWAVAAFAILLLDPAAATGVSFQMSFAAVLALISGYEALRPLLRRLHGPGAARRAALHLAMLTLTSLLAGAASAPYGAFHFGRVQAYFIAANVLAVPLTALWVMPCGLLGLALLPLGLERLAWVPMGWGVDALLAIGRTVSAWPAATAAVPPVPAWGLLAFSVGLAWLGLWRSRWRLAGLAPLLAGLLSPLAANLPDVLVSPDARLIALRTGGAYYVQRTAGDAFELGEWQAHFGGAAFAPIRDGDPSVCGPASCRLGAILLMRDAMPAQSCEGVTLVVSAEPQRGRCPAAQLIDRFTVWRAGAQAVWLTGGAPRVLSDRDLRGDRPWVPPPPSPRARRSNLPVAPAESIPPE